jgi:hypothetical protein
VSYTISKVPLANAKNKPTQTKKQNMVGKKTSFTDVLVGPAKHNSGFLQWYKEFVLYPLLVRNR